MTLYQKDFPPDIRVENEAKRLVAEGHEIVLVCTNRTGRSQRDTYRGIKVIRVNPLPWLLRKVNALIYLLFIFNLHWFLTLRKLNRQLKFDVFHVHDLPLSRTVLLLAHLCQRPVVLDFHENFPVLLQSPYRRASLTAIQRLYRRLFFGLARWKRYEKEVALRSNHVIVVIEEARERLCKLGVPGSRITVVSNTIDIEDFDSCPRIPEIERRFEGAFVISYVGALTSYRRIDTVILAMPKILEKIPEAHLLIVGNIDWRLEYKDLAIKLGVQGHVSFEGRQPFDRVPTYMRLSHVGLVPHAQDEHTDNTIPHKLFQYMYAETPVIVSECIPLKRIVLECGCGLVVEGLAEDPSKLADAVIALADPKTRQEMGRRGKEAVLSRYHWAVDAGRLVSLYSSLVSS
jgi:glycosyltransferase involved in cell wall biosynthesis